MTTLPTFLWKVAYFLVESCLFLKIKKVQMTLTGNTLSKEERKAKS